MSEQKPRWASEMLNVQHASSEIVCKTCMFRKTECNGIKLDRADTCTCQIYEDPEIKPQSVYFDGAPCEYYEAANER